MGIEPTYPAWKAGVLPLNYTRVPDYNIINLKKIKSFLKNKIKKSKKIHCKINGGLSGRKSKTGMLCKNALKEKRINGIIEMFECDTDDCKRNCRRHYVCDHRLNDME